MKHLILEVLTTEWGVKLLRVKEQTHRGEEFGHLNNIYTAKNGFVISSQKYPDTTTLYSYNEEGVTEYGCFSVCGTASDKDNRVAVVPSERWLERCREAVRGYNEEFAAPPNVAQNAHNPTVEVIE